MPVAEQTVDRRRDSSVGFLALATGEIKTAVESISLYAALLEAQSAHDPSLGPLREIVHDVRVQASLVAALIDDALSVPDTVP
jgi:signal transduction histidine kinase